MTENCTLHDYIREVQRLMPDIPVIREEFIRDLYAQGWSAATAAKRIRMLLAGTEFVKRDGYEGL
jgi:hypothetical protein